MTSTIEGIRSVTDLKAFIHRTLCEKENLLEDAFQMTEMELKRCNRSCGLQFSLHGPRSVRLGAIWASDVNTIYFYDAQGERFDKVRLTRRLLPELEELETEAA
jgi:hypothetical protein